MNYRTFSPTLRHIAESCELFSKPTYIEDGHNFSDSTSIQSGKVVRQNSNLLSRPFVASEHHLSLKIASSKHCSNEPEKTHEVQNLCIAQKNLQAHEDAKKRVSPRNNAIRLCSRGTWPLDPCQDKAFRHLQKLSESA